MAATAPIAPPPPEPGYTFIGDDGGNSTDIIGSLIGTKNNVTDNSIVSGLYISAGVGGVFFLLFCWLQTRSVLYRYRQVCDSVSVKPPTLPTKGFAAYWGWAYYSITTSDLTLLQSSGLDAMMHIKILALGVQMMLPLCVFSMGILLPIHAVSDYFQTDASGNTSYLMRLTIANLRPQSQLLWIHMVFYICYVQYACWLLNWHYKQYLTIRQHYLRKGMDSSHWNDLFSDGESGKLFSIRHQIWNILPGANTEYKKEGLFVAFLVDKEAVPALYTDDGGAAELRVARQTTLRRRTSTSQSQQMTSSADQVTLRHSGSLARTSNRPDRKANNVLQSTPEGMNGMEESDELSADATGATNGSGQLSVSLQPSPITETPLAAGSPAHVRAEQAAITGIAVAVEAAEAATEPDLQITPNPLYGSEASATTSTTVQSPLAAVPAPAINMAQPHTAVATTNISTATGNDAGNVAGLLGAGAATHVPGAGLGAAAPAAPAAALQQAPVTQTMGAASCLPGLRKKRDGQKGTARFHEMSRSEGEALEVQPDSLQHYSLGRTSVVGLEDVPRWWSRWEVKRLQQPAAGDVGANNLAFEGLPGDFGFRRSSDTSPTFAGFTSAAISAAAAAFASAGARATARRPIGTAVINAAGTAAAGGADRADNAVSNAEIDRDPHPSELSIQRFQRPELRQPHGSGQLLATPGPSQVMTRGFAAEEAPVGRVSTVANVVTDHDDTGFVMPLSKPSVSILRTIEASDVWTGKVVGVDAQHYAILVTDVLQPLFPPIDADGNFIPKRKHRSGFLGRFIRRKWLFHDYARNAAAIVGPQDLALDLGGANTSTSFPVIAKTQPSGTLGSLSTVLPQGSMSLTPTPSRDNLRGCWDRPMLQPAAAAARHRRARSIESGGSTGSIDSGSMSYTTGLSMSLTQPVPAGRARTGSLDRPVATAPHPTSGTPPSPMGGHARSRQGEMQPEHAMKVQARSPARLHMHPLVRHRQQHTEQLKAQERGMAPFHRRSRSTGDPEVFLAQAAAVHTRLAGGPAAHASTSNGTSSALPPRGVAHSVSGGSVLSSPLNSLALEASNASAVAVNRMHPHSGRDVTPSRAHAHGVPVPALVRMGSIQEQLRQQKRQYHEVQQRQQRLEAQRQAQAAALAHQHRTSPLGAGAAAAGRSAGIADVEDVRLEVDAGAFATPAGRQHAALASTGGRQNAVRVGNSIVDAPPAAHTVLTVQPSLPGPGPVAEAVESAVAGSIAGFEQSPQRQDVNVSAASDHHHGVPADVMSGSAAAIGTSAFSAAAAAGPPPSPLAHPVSPADAVVPQSNGLANGSTLQSAGSGNHLRFHAPSPFGVHLHKPGLHHAPSQRIPLPPVPSGQAVVQTSLPLQATQRKRLPPGAGWAAVRAALANGTLLDLPFSKRYSTVTATFLRLFPEEFDRAIPVIKHMKVDQLLMKMEMHLGQYEFAWEHLRQTGNRLTRRTGCCSLWGKRYDCLDHHKQRIMSLRQQVVIERKHALQFGGTPSWFVFFKTQRAAAIAAQCVIHAEDNREFQVRAAPAPEEVNWQALWLNYHQRDFRTIITFPIFLIVVFFPIGIFTGGLQQLDYVFCPSHQCLNTTTSVVTSSRVRCSTGLTEINPPKVAWPWYCDQSDVFSRLLQKLVVGWLPTLLLALWQGMLIPILSFLAVQARGNAPSLSDLDMQISAFVFYFGLFNVFIGGIIGGTVTQGINDALTQGPNQIFNLVGTFLPTSTNFFLSYVMFRTFVSTPWRLIQPHGGIRWYLLRRYVRFSKIFTDRDRAIMYAPVSPRYGFEIGMVMILYLISWGFVVIAPLLTPLIVICFAVSWLFWRYTLLYVFVRKYESGGANFPYVFQRITIAIIVGAIFTACVFIVKRAFVQAFVLLIIVPLRIYRLQRFCYNRYQRGVMGVPLEYADVAPVPVPTGPLRSYVDTWIYTPAPMREQALSYYPEWQKCWEGWGLPAYSW